MGKNDEKLNCWEILDCGRGPGEEKAEDDPCPAATSMSLDGINSGKNGGRICWALQGTKCEGCFAEKMPQCVQCEVYHHVQDTESEEDFVMYPSNVKEVELIQDVKD